MSSPDDRDPVADAEGTHRATHDAGPPAHGDGALRALHDLAAELGVSTRYVDGLGRTVEVPTGTLLEVCSALGPTVDSVGSAGAALEEVRARASDEALPPVLVAWDGQLAGSGAEELKHHIASASGEAVLELEDGTTLPLQAGTALSLEADGTSGKGAGPPRRLPPGYHRLRIHTGADEETCTVISAPERAWHHPDDAPSWGLSAHLTAIRSQRSRSVGDLADLETFARWMSAHGGDVVAVLPLLPTFNRAPSEPSPYAPVSRLFWSELILDLGDDHESTEAPPRIDVARAAEEVRSALAGRPEPDPSAVGGRLRRYARFRGAQARLGRDWRSWPPDARSGGLQEDQVDREEARFHRKAQVEAARQLESLRDRLGSDGVRIGLDLPVGVHPDGFDTWRRPGLFASGMSVGAPPDRAFPSGQDWGFLPVHPRASRAEGHAYTAEAVGHHAHIAGVLRIDHVMSLRRLFWIPHGGEVRHGTYVGYPMEELLAVHILESHRQRCVLVGENLGTVPEEIDEALRRHAIHGMSFAQFEAEAREPEPPGDDEVAMVGNHDTATLLGWLEGRDIEERVRHDLVDPEDAAEERQTRESMVRRIMEAICGDEVEAGELLEGLLRWLGASPSPLVLPWVEDLWLEPEPVNVPGTRSSDRPNWQRVWRRTLDDVMDDPRITALLGELDAARATADDGREDGEAGRDGGE